MNIKFHHERIKNGKKHEGAKAQPLSTTKHHITRHPVHTKPIHHHVKINGTVSNSTAVAEPKAVVAAHSINKTNDEIILSNKTNNNETITNATVITQPSPVLLDQDGNTVKEEELLTSNEVSASWLILSSISSCLFIIVSVVCLLSMCTSKKGHGETPGYKALKQ
jgi:hypothetical protein